MKQTLLLLAVFAVALPGSLAADAEPADEAECDETEECKTIALFNGEDLEDWHIYLDDPDVDPDDVWQVRDGAIWCKGQPFGFLRTKKKYGDFKLTLEWRWVDEPTNSGVLLRMTDEDKIWPLCVEAQLRHERAGDVVGMGCDFNENIRDEGEFFRLAPRQNDSSEKEPGEWNTYELICKGDTLELIVNGTFQNKATGIEVPEQGYVGLQSEGSPIMFRNLKLTPLD